MGIEPTNYYRTHDDMLPTLSGVRDRIKEIVSYAAGRGLEVYWRGHKDQRWGLTSSLVRTLARIRVPDDQLLKAAEDRLLKEAASWVEEFQDPKYATPLARLAFMQHHGIPTRLLDFTRDPWMAVFFAVEAPDDVDGRMFALLVDKGAVLGAPPTGTPWQRYSTDEIRIWDPVASGLSFPRLKNQGGVLAVGRMPSTQPHRTAWDPELNAGAGDYRSMLAEEVRRILSIPFRLNAMGPNVAPPIGLTFRIHVDKESVRRDLRGAGRGRHIYQGATPLTHMRAYPDAAGMVEHSELIRGLERGVLVL